ncbi:MAG: helix-turn-helix domain-containing protein [Bacteroidia bacterium]
MNPKQEEKQYLKRLGENIKKIRLAKNMKQVDLANACNFDRQNMYHIEAGGHNLTILNIRKIAKELGVTVSQIVDV